MTLEERLLEQDIINLNDWEAAELLNTLDQTILVESAIPIEEILFFLQKWGVYGELQWQAQRGSTEVISKLCHQILSVLQPSKTVFHNIDIKDPLVYQSFQSLGVSLVSAGLLTQDQYDILWNLRLKPKSWAEYNLGHSVTSREIGLIRGGK